jgi:hypothetical protein
MAKKLMHFYAYGQSHHIILRQPVSVTSVTIIRVSYKKNTIDTLIRVLKCVIKPLNVTLKIS